MDGVAKGRGEGPRDSAVVETERGRFVNRGGGDQQDGLVEGKGCREHTTEGGGIEMKEDGGI